MLLKACPSLNEVHDRNFGCTHIVAPARITVVSLKPVRTLFSGSRYICQGNEVLRVRLLTSTVFARSLT
jgi:hypothetical protein